MLLLNTHFNVIDLSEKLATTLYSISSDDIHWTPEGHRVLTSYVVTEEKGG